MADQTYPSGWCRVDDCPVEICNGPHVEHFCPNGDMVAQHIDSTQLCPFCGGTFDFESERQRLGIAADTYVNRACDLGGNGTVQ